MGPSVSMVQLSQSPFRCPSPSGHSEGGEDKSMKPAKQQATPGQPGENQPPLSPLQSSLNPAATPSQAYETYIDNGLICLKHKIRNIEKKKLKLEDYRDRLKKGEALNQDQLEAVEKYDEVLHNLEFAKELQKTFSGLSQDLLRAQRKAQRRDTIMKLEAEKKKLRTILQVQYVLQNFTQEHVQKDFKGGLNGAIYLPSKELDYLIRFAKLTCPERSENLSVEDQMEQSSLYFWDLLEGSEKAVVGTTYKHMKELLSKLLNSGYFENIPVPRNMQIKEELEEEVIRKSQRTRQLPKGESVKEPEPLMKLLQSEIQPQEFLNRRYLPEAEGSIKKPEECKPWEAEYTRKQEPPKSWEMLVDLEEQEQKKQKQESLKPWESCGRHQEQKKQESPKLWEACVREEEGQKQESSKPWETSVRGEEPKKQETPKPWVTNVREEQDSPKPWITKVKEEQEQRKQESPRLWATKVREEQEQRKQESPRPWATKVQEEPDQKQESPRPWITQTREEPEQKKQEPVKPWGTRGREEPEQKKQEPVKPWGMRVREEPEQKKQEPVKSWETRVREESEQKKQDPPKAWETSDRQQPVSSQQLQNTPKSWGAASLVPKEQIGPKKFDVEPKDRRDRRQKHESEVKRDGKTDGLSGGHGFDAVRKKEVLQSVGESFKLPRSLQSNVQVPKPGHQSAAEFCCTSTLPKDPILRREKLQDLMTQIQGTYNFMQESILDVDKASPSAICSSQPPSVTPAGSPVASKEQKLPSQNDFLQQPPQAAASPITLHGSNTSLASADHTLSGSETDDLMTPQTPQTSELLSQETENYTSSQPPYQTSPCISEPVISKKIEIAQATIPLPRDPQSPLPTSSTSMSSVSQGQTFQSPPASSSSVTINAAPFQAMQTVFKVNAPLPPRKEQEIKDDSSYSAGYNQSFSTASTQTPPQCQLQSTHVAEQNSLSQETLPTVNYQPDGAVPVSNGSLAFYPAQTVFTRPTQPYLNNRGSVRGSARGGRSLTNSYRSPGGYKGFDAYRGSPSIPNGNYGQLQFAGRDYPGIPYSQRDVNYQQCYKRGGVTGGPRSNSRAGWSDSSQVSSPERDNETFNSGDSGQGDSRSITPVDMPVTSQAATILPVHVYPLPQQMRVAFSAARTSNLAPGTLDQPIAFDLLLNNLGETFDIQLGRFNCPVNGTYVFIFHMLKLAVNVPLYVNLMKNEEVLVSAYANDGAPDHETASNHAVLQLFQGDQIWLRLHRGAIYGSSWKYSTFSGYLLYQD
ncbi:caprin-2 isoform X5 [Trachemys scripta elegans]|uniref:caprin-2 isoform X4 n=1 Tax=Trachemys scripta elegans TaxID=31138 RepID=UPI001553F92E|nr:caprin-2 isoform X4 [Trachemys scripta elegans]XP_034636229.1 caprin-2 isoform X5 [Trachemys scripta elegans]